MSSRRRHESDGRDRRWRHGRQRRRGDTGSGVMGAVEHGETPASVTPALSGLAIITHTAAMSREVVRRRGQLLGQQRTSPDADSSSRTSKCLASSRSAREFSACARGASTRLSMTRRFARPLSGPAVRAPASPRPPPPPRLCQTQLGCAPAAPVRVRAPRRRGAGTLH